jgi:hypothetical protein
MRTIKAKDMKKNQVYVVPSLVTGAPTLAQFRRLSKITGWALVHPCGNGALENWWAVDPDVEVFCEGYDDGH